MTDSTADIVVTARTGKRDPNSLTLIVNGSEISGWERVEVKLLAEGFPNSFQVQGSIPPNYQLPVVEGASCSILLGDDRVITGYIDRVRDKGDAESHQIFIVGRGCTQDLVDCGAEWPSHQMLGGNALTVATQLALPYSIGVEMLNGADPGPDIPQWALNYGETAASIIQRVARNAGLLAYEDHTGKLVLAAAGSAQAASGIAYGVNAEDWEVERSMDQRFSDYVCCGASLDAMAELPGDTFFYTAKDPNVPRHRLQYLVVENVATDAYAFTKKRAEWEASRRVGRSYTAQAVIDSWRDKADKLWMPNTVIPIDLPAAHQVVKWVISEVTFRRDSETGTTAEILAMPSTAFTPEPITLIPVNTADIRKVQ